METLWFGDRRRSSFAALCRARRLRLRRRRAAPVRGADGRERRQVLARDRPVLGRQRGLAARRRRRAVPRVPARARVGPLGVLLRDHARAVGADPARHRDRVPHRTSPTPMWRGFWDATFSLASLARARALRRGARQPRARRAARRRTAGSRSRCSSRSRRPARSGSSTGTPCSRACSRSPRSCITARCSSPGRPTATCRCARGRLAAVVFPVVVLLWIVATVATWFVAPPLVHGFQARPLAWICAGVFVAGLVTSAIARRAGRERVRRSSAPARFCSACSRRRPPRCIR